MNEYWNARNALERGQNGPRSRHFRQGFCGDCARWNGWNATPIKLWSVYIYNRYIGDAFQRVPAFQGGLA